jgi:hypothetical protein
MPGSDRDREYLAFMARTFRLHELVQRFLASRFPEPPEGGGPATFLKLTPIHTPPIEASLGVGDHMTVPPVSLDWPADDELRLWTWAGLHAAMIEVACEAGLTSLAPVYGVERKAYLKRAAAHARELHDGDRRVRQAIREFIFPGERVFGEAYVRQAYEALHGRFGRTFATLLLGRLRVLPGLEGDFWPLAEPHLARWKKPLALGPVKRLALRGALGLAAKLARMPREEDGDA